ncbi:MAG: hypothetical protein H7222_03655 [Methylotenera sp.]|nr:hypothetical protein [Oligoflexia bacterium]
MQPWNFQKYPIRSLQRCWVLAGLFSIVFTPESRTVVIPVSLIYGFILGASLYPIFMPLGLNIALVQRMPEPLFLISQVIFGAGLMLVIPFFRRIEANYLHSLIATPIRSEEIEDPTQAA